MTDSSFQKIHRTYIAGQQFRWTFRLVTAWRLPTHLVYPSYISVGHDILTVPLQHSWWYTINPQCLVCISKLRMMISIILWSFLIIMTSKGKGFAWNISWCAPWFLNTDAEEEGPPISTDAECLNKPRASHRDLVVNELNWRKETWKKSEWWTSVVWRFQVNLCKN